MIERDTQKYYLFFLSCQNNLLPLQKNKFGELILSKNLI